MALGLALGLAQGLQKAAAGLRRRRWLLAKGAAPASAMKEGMAKKPRRTGSQAAAKPVPGAA